jgi:hypothetical protein
MAKCLRPENASAPKSIAYLPGNAHSALVRADFFDLRSRLLTSSEVTVSFAQRQK